MENCPTAGHEFVNPALSSRESIHAQSIDEQVDEGVVARPEELHSDNIIEFTNPDKWCEETKSLWSQFKQSGYDNIPKLSDEETDEILKNYNFQSDSNSLEAAFAQLDKYGVHAPLACIELGEYTPDKYQGIINRCIAIKPRESAINIDIILEHVSSDINKQQLVNMFVDMGYGEQIARNVDRISISDVDIPNLAERLIETGQIKALVQNLELFYGVDQNRIIAEAIKTDSISEIACYLNKMNDLSLNTLYKLKGLGYIENVDEYSAEQPENVNNGSDSDDESAVA